MGPAKAHTYLPAAELKKSFSVTDSDEGVDVVGSVSGI